MDTNVLVYLFSDEPDKQQRANALLISAPPEETLVISTQVIGEFVNVCLRRGLLSETETAALIDVFASAAVSILPRGATTTRASDDGTRHH